MRFDPGPFGIPSPLPARFIEGGGTVHVKTREVMVWAGSTGSSARGTGTWVQGVAGAALSQNDGNGEIWGK